MTRRDLICILLGAIFSVLLQSRGDELPLAEKPAVSATKVADLRLEGALGRCKYTLGPDTDWYYKYGGYQTDMPTLSTCGLVGLRWGPHSGLGARLSYVDLGRVRASNTYPTNEGAYVAARNSGSAVVSPTAYYQGNGGSRGLTLGPVLEAPTILGVDLQVEAGGAVLYNWWHALTHDETHWQHADGWNATWYAGIGVRYRYVFALVRRYNNVHANGGTSSSSQDAHLYIGPTTGPAYQALVGVSIPL